MDFNKLKKEKLKPIIAIVSVIVVFSVVYLGSYYYRLNQINATNTEQEVSGKKEDALDDNVIILFTRTTSDGKEEVYYRLTVGEMRKNLRLDNIKEEDLVKVLEAKGFKKNVTTDGSLSFAKVDGEGLASNKYYIGDKDGYIAIFKTDENGKAFIEKEGDISHAMTEHYPKPDVDKIKGFERIFDTREDCESALSDYTD